LWASVYLHDLARTHDGRCEEHGQQAMQRLAQMIDVRALFERAGVRDSDYPSIETAVIYHCRSQELDRSHPHYELTALLKDADALDRVRLNGLNPAFLRHEVSRQMVPFAEELFARTNTVLAPGPDYFARLWPVALDIARTSLHSVTNA
jgi:hypothetical protein